MTEPAELFSVKGKTAVVTGGSRGIGYMIASTLVSAGVRVYITARKAEAADKAAAELSKDGECISFPGDLSSADGAAAFAKQVAEREDKVHILVNNAGAAWGAPLDDFPEQGFDKVLDTNVKGIFYVTTNLLPQLRAAATTEDPARVINIGSVDGIAVPLIPNYAYSASKAGVHMLTRHLAHALVGEHINVNAIAPGLFRSHMTRFFYDEPEAQALMFDRIPMQRDGTPEDIGGTVIYLSSRAGAYLTGVVIPVSGGIATIT